MTHRFWPVGESAQADYETLREAVLHGEPLQTLAAARFARRGLLDAGTLHIDRAALRDALDRTAVFQGILGTIACDEFGGSAGK